METNIFTRAWQGLKNLIDYSPAKLPDPFVLDEARPYDSIQCQEPLETVEEIRLRRFVSMTEYAGRLSLYMEKVLQAVKSGSLAAELDKYKTELLTLGKQWEELSAVIYSYERSQDPAEAAIDTSLDVNRKKLEIIYRIPRNKDLVIREIEVGKGSSATALIAYMEGLVDGVKLDRFVLEPLMGTRSHLYEGDTIKQLINNVIPNGQIRRVDTFKSLEDGLNVGDTALIIDGIGEAIIVETKGWEHRGVESPKTEQTVRGSLAAFSENLRINTGLVRSLLHSSDLVTELIKIGKRGQLNCAVMYIDSIANTSLVNEVRRRLQGIETDYIADSGQLVQFIEDSPTLVFPQTLSTERPDRVANHLVEGRLAIILEGNPFVQILPVSFFSFFHSGEDFSAKSSITNFLRVIRLFGALISVVLPALYIAISNFHPEAMPTELLLAVAGSRESVPFPAWFEVLMMDISFELIREGGLRVPGVLGSTIGIVGAIILGQAAITAHLVSPIVVVIVAVTGLASFTIPEYRMASAVRLIRFLLFIVASLLGLVGLGMVMLIQVAILCGMKSFGMPYMDPIGPKTTANYDVVIRGQGFDQDRRPDALNTKDSRRQPGISRPWLLHSPKGEREK